MSRLISNLNLKTNKYLMYKGKHKRNLSQERHHQRRKSKLKLPNNLTNNIGQKLRSLPSRSYKYRIKAFKTKQNHHRKVKHSNKFGLMMNSRRKNLKRELVQLLQKPPNYKLIPLFLSHHSSEHRVLKQP